MKAFANSILQGLLVRLQQKDNRRIRFQLIECMCQQNIESGTLVEGSGDALVNRMKRLKPLYLMLVSSSNREFSRATAAWFARVITKCSSASLKALGISLSMLITPTMRSPAFSGIYIPECRPGWIST